MISLEFIIEIFEFFLFVYLLIFFQKTIYFFREMKKSVEGEMICSLINLLYAKGGEIKLHLVEKTEIKGNILNYSGFICYSKGFCNEFFGSGYIKFRLNGSCIEVVAYND